MANSGSALKQLWVWVVVIMLAAAFACAPASGESIFSKMSTEENDTTPPPDDLNDNPHPAEIMMEPTDATTASSTISFDGSQFSKDKSIAANSITMNCNGTPVSVSHDVITMAEYKFYNAELTLDANDAVAALAAAAPTTYVWCTLTIAETAGFTWTFPYAIRLDRTAPDITTAGNFYLYPLKGKNNGILCGSLFFQDALTPGDADGQTPLGCTLPLPSDCNRTDHKFKYLFYKRDFSSTTYSEIYDFTVDKDSLDFCTVTSQMDPGDPKNRDDADNEGLCFKVKVLDSAGNKSDISSDGDGEKCIILDNKPPEILSVEYYADSAFTKPFLTVSNEPVMTTNACYINAGCDLATPRYAYLKITASEPLYDGQGPWGAALRASDGFDNDNDGLIDEELFGYDANDNDADNAAYPDPSKYIDEDVSMTNCINTVGTMGPDDEMDNDCDGLIDEEYDNDKDEDTCHPENGADKNCKNDPVTANIDEDLRQFGICGDKELWNFPFLSCVPAPALKIVGTDLEGIVPASNGNNPKDQLRWICTSGYGSDPMCSGLATGTTVYRYRWNVSGPIAHSPLNPIGLEEGDYDVTFSMADSVGNEVTDVDPDEGGTVAIDNAGPTITVSLSKDAAMMSFFNTANHDNDDGTSPVMPVAKAGDIYVGVQLDDYAGATPTVAVYFPDVAAPVYNGRPAAGNLYPLTAYTTCNQNALCDWCTGEYCTGYATDTDPCKFFKGCFNTDDLGVNNGYAAISAYAKDRLENSSWDPDMGGADPDAHAKASQTDEDRAHDDTDTTGGDGYPTYLGPYADDPDNNEPDATVSGHQYVALDFEPPDAPAASLPITPCDGTMARVGETCSVAAQTTRAPLFSWAPLANGDDDDGDGSTDEEIVDGLDDDLDGDIDEDATGTSQKWMVRMWHLQVATDNTFATSSLVVDANSVIGYDYQMPGNLPDRTLDTPYYWRISAIDYAGNEGSFSPQTPAAYWTFGVDTTKPELSVEYFSDASRTIPLQTTPEGIPVTGDTADEGGFVYITLTASEPLGASPTFVIEQFENQVDGPLSTTSASSTVFYGEFEVDALGSDKVYQEGPAELFLSAVDLFGNAISGEAPVTGDMFYVDAAEPTIEPSDITITPIPASRDNDGDGTFDELHADIGGGVIEQRDAVKIQIGASEKLLNPYFQPAVEFLIRVKQPNVPSAPTLDDMLDNDCDGLIDEEDPSAGGGDDDNDGVMNEDTGSGGAVAGSGCLVEVELDPTSNSTYIGYYNVYKVASAYDGKVDVIIGDTVTTSKYYVTDYAGNPVYATTSFTIDTQPPLPVTLLSPLNSANTANSTPQFGWRVQRESGLSKYNIEIASNITFTTLVATGTVMDDGSSTDYNYNVSTALADNTYYWRVFSVDSANNKSSITATYTLVIDTTAPSPPEFDDVDENPTTNSFTALSGKTYVPGSFVKIYINDSYIGTWQADSTANGAFTVTLDQDSDGSDDEDDTAGLNGIDDDDDGLIDEDPPGIFLQEGKNYIAGQVIDRAGNTGSRGCDSDTSFYDTDEAKCYVTRDSGYPTFFVSYFSDADLTDPVPQICSDPEVLITCKPAAKAGTLYMKITASEELGETGNPRPPTFTIKHQGSESVVDRPTTSLEDSLTSFVGSYTVRDANGTTYVDGAANLFVVGVDNQNNTTPDDVTPNTGGQFVIDSDPPEFQVRYYSDVNFLNPLPKDPLLIPNAKAGDIWLRLQSNEKVSAAPLVSINQPGSNDIDEQQSTAIEDNDYAFYYKYTVHDSGGSTYVDGDTQVTVTAADVAGNQATNAAPTSGATFEIDTTAPNPPTLTLDTYETIYTQVEGSGSTEAYADIEVFLRLYNSGMIPDDGVDNDGDGRIDEEPTSPASTDSDNDFFVDEDTTAQTCAAGKYWGYEQSNPDASACVNTPVNEPDPNGTAGADNLGAFDITITGVNIGTNLVYARAIDTAGNASDLDDFTALSLVNNAPENITLTHEFEEGWNLVGIPFQPTIKTPGAGLQVSGYDIFRYQDPEYAYKYDLEGMAPGMCYWIKFPADTTIVTYGLTSTTSTVHLEEGWNMVGLPFSQNSTWDSNVKVKNSAGTFFDLGTTEAGELIDEKIYFFNPATEAYSASDPDDNKTLEPWVGFLIKAAEECDLVFPQ